MADNGTNTRNGRVASRGDAGSGRTPTPTLSEKSAVIAPTGKKLATQGGVASRGQTLSEKAREKAMGAINGVEAALAKLREDGYVAAGEGITTMKISQIMMQLTASVIPETAAIIKAVAVLVEEMGMKEMTKGLVRGLEGPISELKESVEQMKAGWGEELIGTAVQAIMEEIGGPVEDLKKLRDELSGWHEGFEEQVKEVRGEAADLRMELADM